MAKVRELNVVMALAGRDLLKFFRDPGRMVAAVIFPFAMIFLLGGTLQLNLGKAADSTSSASHSPVSWA